jgi:hypothetical protein
VSIPSASEKDMKKVLLFAAAGLLAATGASLAQDRTPPIGVSTGAANPPIDQSPRGAAAAAASIPPAAPTAQGIQTPNAPAVPEFKNR